MRVCRVCHNDEEMRLGVTMMKRDISRITDQLETQSQMLEEVSGVCEKTNDILEHDIDPDVEVMKDDISSITEELETQRKKLEEVGKVCEKTHESVENILKELQKQQNSRTESATGRKRSKEKQKVDPLCRVSHLSKE